MRSIRTWPKKQDSSGCSGRVATYMFAAGVVRHKTLFRSGARPSQRLPSERVIPHSFEKGSCFLLSPIQPPEYLSAPNSGGIGRLYLLTLSGCPVSKISISAVPSVLRSHPYISTPRVPLGHGNEGFWLLSLDCRLKPFALSTDKCVPSLSGPVLLNLDPERRGGVNRGGAGAGCSNSANAARDRNRLQSTA